MSKDWTNRLPELLEGYTEAEPEGLWDAVQAGLAPKPRRRVIAGWWYAGGALLAAAAVSAVFFLWPSRPVTPSVTPIAEVASSSEETIVPEVTVVPGELIAQVPSVQPAPPSGKTPQIPDETLPEAPPSAKTPEIPDEAPSEAPPSVKTPEITDEAPSEAPPSVKTPQIPDEAPSEALPSGKTPQIPDETNVKSRSVPSLKVQIGMSGTGYLSQAATSTTTGVGIPTNIGIRPNALPLTKANSTGSTNESVMTRMLSRNKASTTNAVHGQTARLALGVTVGITEHWAVETGVVFSSLFSNYDTEAGGSNERLMRTMNYCGIPLYARYNALEWKRLSLFLNAGPMYEYTTKTSVNKTTFAGRTQTGFSTDNTLIHDAKWSLNAGGGVQLRVLEHGALYVLPGVSYHFAGNSTLENFYTEHPLSASLTFGYNFIF